VVAGFDQSLRAALRRVKLSDGEKRTLLCALSDSWERDHPDVVGLLECAQTESGWLYVFADGETDSVDDAMVRLARVMILHQGK
jgi:hypothetical protein